jgi:DNA-binding NarL/FixJ family response regulator
VERDVASLRTALGEDAFVHASAVGYTAPLNQIVAEALSEAPPQATSRTISQTTSHPDTETRADHRPGAARPRTGREHSGPSTPLTAREREVAALVAERLTNCVIATRLGTSPRTIDTHVGKILAKLGVTSRGEVAAALPAHLEDHDDGPDHAAQPPLA